MATVHSFPHTEKAHRKGDAQQWVCRVCETIDGVATSAVMTIKLAPMIEAGKLKGGTNQTVCAHCWRHGRTTIAS